MANKPRAREPGIDRILDIALGLYAERRWQDITMEEISEASGATLPRVYEFFPTRQAILARLFARIDKAVLSDHDFADSTEPSRERLLDVLMRRFEAQSSYKLAIHSLLRSLGSDPALAICSLPVLANSMAWSLEASGIGASGPMGLAKIQGLGLIYLSATRVWLNDDSPDLGATMACLDRDLSRAGKLINLFPHRKNPSREID
ncbi:MAG: hypothetical protein CFH41_00107 [Alphaproteobacteria bacterium MarineAlpha11_Bin1]|nr:MAG: hypothetical protein CFH41_00107 [Alphaproteobacteria bacterium MarineAlpha11_Bin1]|tara:strand:+ start:8128 stop:8739 length:612 start_codon:yes stop_codon:yes gene_type:complete